MILQSPSVEADNVLMMTTKDIVRRSGVAVAAAAMAGAMLVVGQVSATEDEATVNLSDVCTNPGLSFASTTVNSIWMTNDVRPASWSQNETYPGRFRHRNGSGMFTAADGTQFRFERVAVVDGLPVQPLGCNLAVRQPQN